MGENTVMHTVAGRPSKVQIRRRLLRCRLPRSQRQVTRTPQDLSSDDTVLYSISKKSWKRTSNGGHETLNEAELKRLLSVG